MKKYIKYMLVCFTLFLFQLGFYSCGNNLHHHKGVYREMPYTCTERGIRGHYECNGCGRLFLDVDCTNEVAFSELLITPKHDYDEIGQCKHCQTFQLAFQSGTYRYSHYELEFSENVTEESKEEYRLVYSHLMKKYQNSALLFAENGVLTRQPYLEEIQQETFIQKESTMIEVRRKYKETEELSDVTMEYQYDGHTLKTTWYANDLKEVKIIAVYIYDC